MPALRFDEDRAEEGYDCPKCDGWIPAHREFCPDCDWDTKEDNAVSLRELSEAEKDENTITGQMTDHGFED